ASHHSCCLYRGPLSSPSPAPSLPDALPISLDRAHDHPALRTTSTMDALRAAGETALIPQRSACVLREADRCGISSASPAALSARSEEHTSELQSRFDIVCRLLLEKKNLIIH